MLPTKEYRKLDFIYEHAVKYCVDCKTLGHSPGGRSEKNSNKKVGDSNTGITGNRKRSSSHNRWGNTYHGGRSRTHHTRNHDPPLNQTEITNNQEGNQNASTDMIPEDVKHGDIQKNKPLK